MPVLINKGQTINGISVPAGFAIFGLDKDTEDKLKQGGGGQTVNLAVLGDADAAAFKGMVSKAGKVSAPARDFNFTLQGQNTSAAVTLVSQRPALGKFYALRVWYCNYDTAAWTVTAAKAAAVTAHLSDGIANAGTPVALTFNDAGTSTVAASSGTSSDALPQFLGTDVTPLASMDRTDDTSKRRLVQIRTYAAGTQNVLLPVPSGMFANYNGDARSNGRQYASGAPAGDAVSTWSAQTPSASSNPFVHPAVVEFFYENSARTVAQCGDSIGMGQLTTASGVTISQFGHAQVLCDALMAKSSVIWQAMNFANASQTYQASCTTAKRVLTAFRPNDMLMHAWSPNNTPSSDSVMLDCRARLLEVAQLAATYGTRMHIITSGPVNSYSAPYDARIKAQNAWVKQLQAAGVWDVIDAAALLDPTNSGQIAAAYNGDGLHYNDAYYAAFATLGANGGQFF